MGKADKELPTEGVFRRTMEARRKTSWFEAIRAVHRLLVRGVEGAALVALAAMGGSVFLMVLDRYLLGIGYFWPEELARFSFIWCSLLGASIAVERRGHFAVTFFSEKFLTGRKTSPLNAVVGGCSIVAVLILIIKGFELTTSAGGQISPALRIPMSWVFLAVPVAGVLMLYFMLVQVGVAVRPSHQ